MGVLKQMLLIVSNNVCKFILPTINDLQVKIKNFYESFIYFSVILCILS